MAFRLLAAVALTVGAAAEPGDSSVWVQKNVDVRKHGREALSPQEEWILAAGVLRDQWFRIIDPLNGTSPYGRQQVWNLTTALRVTSSAGKVSQEVVLRTAVYTSDSDKVCTIAMEGTDINRNDSYHMERILNTKGKQVTCADREYTVPEGIWEIWEGMRDQLFKHDPVSVPWWSVLSSCDEWLLAGYSLGGMVATFFAACVTPEMASPNDLKPIKLYSIGSPPESRPPMRPQNDEPCFKGARTYANGKGKKYDLFPPILRPLIANYHHPFIDAVNFDTRATEDGEYLYHITGCGEQGVTTIPSWPALTIGASPLHSGLNLGLSLGALVWAGHGASTWAGRKMGASPIWLGNRNAGTGVGGPEIFLGVGATLGAFLGVASPSAGILLGNSVFACGWPSCADLHEHLIYNYEYKIAHSRRMT